MAVRRCLLLLLTIVALQQGWGAVSAYCTHESGAAARHFGHHQHGRTQHLPPGSAGKSATVKQYLGHSHCPSCAHGVLAVAPALPVISRGAFRLAVSLAADCHCSTIDAARPERPQWARAA